MDKLTYLSNTEGPYIDSLYQDFKSNPAEVDGSWRKFFEGFEYAQQSGLNGAAGAGKAGDVTKELSVAALINAYRDRGHLLATTNPIRERKDRHPHLELSDFNLSDEDLDKKFAASALVNKAGATLKETIAHLKLLYCGNIGVEYTYIENREQREWFQQQYESSVVTRRITVDKAKRILSKLNEAVVFENFLHTKFVGQKRFSLEGGETTIPAIDAAINRAADLGVEFIAIGMAHRGRLNVLANILGKTYDYIFNEFEGNIPEGQTMGDGDVKYHMGFAGQADTPSGKKVYLKLAPNPSHLEAVNSVVQGITRCKADRIYERNVNKVMPILIHGDAALAGQGVVYEYAQMSNLPGYFAGGTLHFVINNQIGFTTDFDVARSSIYCTGVAYVSESPVIHVNGDDPEAVVFAIELATEYRMKFNKDVYVDMVCYRKYGHNEGDEPKYTQPILYSKIAGHKDPRQIYSDMLVKRGEIAQNLAEQMEQQFRDLLSDRFNSVKQKTSEFKLQPSDQEWTELQFSESDSFDSSPETAVSREMLVKVTEALSTLPADMHPIKKAENEVARRRQAFEEDKLPWAMGELLAYGTLLLEGHNVRMSGQDVERGTFSHRHAVITDSKVPGKKYINLNHLSDDQGRFQIYNSLLSEYAVLGFEYGYALGGPHDLTLWEAQFGDFSNGAQVIVDQFISSAESKWGQQNGLVMLLPHGYEGQGPEHSSARPERYLDMAAQNNMIIANCTTPANFFHLLRRQVQWPFRKPLIVFTPKSLLRNPLAVSKVSDFTDGKFQEVIPDTYVTKGKVKRIIFCSGKVYYDLYERQQQDKRKDVAIVRVEQLYPMPDKQLKAIADAHPKAEQVWLQEEPKNMGAYTYWLRCDDNKSHTLISRRPSASPATGYAKIHAQQQKELIDEAFNI